MIAARALRPIRLEPDDRERWGEQIEELLLPRLEPTLPLFGAGDEPAALPEEKA
jgi:hypothetical protein